MGPADRVHEGRAKTSFIHGEECFGRDPARSHDGLLEFGQ
jgi:hypothetical protein